MDRTLTDFVRSLRTSDVRVSTSETIDAINVIKLVGLNDRELLRNSLAVTLPKTDIEKEHFESCFDRFFTFASINEFGAEAPDEYDIESDEEPDEFGEGSGGKGSGFGGLSGFDFESGYDEEMPLPDDITVLEQALESKGITIESPLARMIIRGDRQGLTIAMANAAQAIELNKIEFFTQKGIYTRKIMMHMGLKEMEDEMYSYEASEDPFERAIGRKIREAREYLRVEVRDYVEKQFILIADAEGKELKEEITRNIKLSNMELKNFSNIKQVVQKMAKRLIAMHSRRKKVTNRGVLDVRKTLRRNMAYDGLLFETHWKSTKVDRPKIMVVCDVSGSVREVSRFLLMFLYSLTEILPNVRAFAFSANLFEVTDLFKKNSLEKAVEETLDQYGFGSTDYGASLQDLKDICFDQIDGKTTVMILGDSRNNHNENRAEILEEIYKRARQVIWLNPEPKTHWRSGDAEMRNYAPFCHMVEVCNSLNHLERIVNKLLVRAN